MHHALIIIGSGPAAATRAIYAARATLSPLVIEGEPRGTLLPGGQLMLTTVVENYPGFPGGIDGGELMTRMKAQAIECGATYREGFVERVSLGQRPFALELADGQVLTADALIIATGSSAKWLHVPGEQELLRSGGGVSACATCDGFSMRGVERCLVVGGGDTMATEALHLAHFAKEVLVLHRGGEFRASPAMAQRVLTHPKIRVAWHREVAEVLGSPMMTGVRVRDPRDGSESHIDAQGLFVAIGHTPNVGFLDGQVALSPHGTIAVAPGRTATNIPGVFAAGDVADPHYRQAVYAAGMGAAAAMDAAAFLHR